MKSEIVSTCLAVVMTCASVLNLAHAQEKVRTESGCNVVMVEVPPPNITVRWNGPCSAQGMANGTGTLQAAGGDMLSYSETGTMAAGNKVGTWFRRYESIGIELRWMHPKNMAPGVDVHKISNHSPERERQAYAFMRKVGEEGDFASPAALGVSHLVQATAPPKPARSGSNGPMQAKRPITASTSNCPQSVQVVEEQYINTFSYAGNGFVSFRNNFGVVSEKWQSIEAALETFIRRERLEQEKARNPPSCTGKDPFGQPAPCPPVYPPADYTRAIEWARCYSRALTATAGKPAADVDNSLLDNITPQVPGCPRYLRKSLVTWSQVGNPQLNTWEIRNVSSKTLTVTYSDTDGINGETNGLGPGSTSSVSLVSRVIPPYVVRDFDELFAFNRTPAARAGKTLKCQLAIRPR